MKTIIEFDKETFDKHGAWILRPEKLIERFGKIDFSTIKFFLENETEYNPKGGGPNKFLNIPLVYHQKDTVVEFSMNDLIPDPWFIEHRVIIVEFEFLK